VAVLNALLLTWSLLPLAAMLLALGAASYIRAGRRESEAQASPSHHDDLRL
jgi:hypothetical protein